MNSVFNQSFCNQPFCCLLLVCVAVLFADERLSAQGIEKTKQTWESRVVEKTSLDVGDVKPGTDLEPVVVFRNQTQEPFVIDSVSSSCGCMKPVMDATTIAPGESTEMKIRLDTERFRGRRSASIHVGFAKPEGREIKISAVVNIRNLICEPEQVQFLGGKKNENQQLTRELVVRRTGSPFWQIKSIESSYVGLSATIESSKIENSKVQYKILCKFKLDSDRKGVQHEVLTLKTNDSKLPAYEVPVVIRNSGEITASPEVLDFSSVEVGKKKMLIVRFQAATEPQVSFESKGGFKLLTTNKINEQTFKLEVVQSDPQAVDSELVIETADGTFTERVKVIANANKSSEVKVGK